MCAVIVETVGDDLEMPFDCWLLREARGAGMPLPVPRIRCALSTAEFRSLLSTFPSGLTTPFQKPCDIQRRIQRPVLRTARRVITQSEEASGLARDGRRSVQLERRRDYQGDGCGGHFKQYVRTPRDATAAAREADVQGPAKRCRWPGGVAAATQHSRHMQSSGRHVRCRRWPEMGAREGWP